jgi:hypothetical protein
VRLALGDEVDEHVARLLLRRRKSVGIAQDRPAACQPVRGLRVDARLQRHRAEGCAACPRW